MRADRDSKHWANVMWCPQCGQDVPGVTLSMSGRMSCARCGRPLSPDSSHDNRGASLAETAAHGVDLGTARNAARNGSYEDWQVDQHVRQVQAKAGRWHRVDRARPMPVSPSMLAPHFQYASRTRPPKKLKRKSTAPQRSSFVAWTVLALGLMALACGAALLACALLQERDELWSLGVPVAAGGQVGLLLGLALQLERVWQNSRYAARKLEQVDSQLAQLERATSMMHVTHGSAAQAFYAHLAHDAPAEVLLADLKGQLDLLAAEVSRRG
jgi:hypothetical protein